MTTALTTDSYPTEYARPPVFDRVPSVEAIQRVSEGQTQAEAMKDDLPAAIRATLIGS